MTPSAGPGPPAGTVETVVQRLRAAPKYRRIDPATIADVVEHEAPRSSSRQDLERRARQRLHRTVAQYLLSTRPAALLRSVERLPSAGTPQLKDWCRSVLATHASTAERLPDLDRFYPAILEWTGPARVVADVACAINPLTVPWLRETVEARYLGYDFNAAYVELAARFLARTYPDCTVVHCDVLLRPQEVRADLALLLKTYHNLEDRRPGAGLGLVDVLAARWVVVSFPLRSRSGRAATFARRHVAQLETLARQRRWGCRLARLSTEEFVIITKGPSGGPGG